MKRLLTAFIILTGVFLQGSTARVPEEQPSFKKAQTPGSPPEKVTQSEQERRMIETRLKGLGYFL